MSLPALTPDDLYACHEKLQKNDVNDLMEWVKKQAHLPSITEYQAILFLHSCRYDSALARKTIDNYFIARTSSPDIHDFVSITTDRGMATNVHLSLVTILPTPTPENYRIVFMRLLDSNPDHYDHVRQFKYFNMVTTLNLYKHGICDGHVMVFDMKGSGFRHMAKISINVSRKTLYYLQEALPIILRSIHFINVASFLDKLLAIMRPFMKKELYEMIHIHSGGIETLYPHVPRHCLPEEYGGQAGTFAALHENTLEQLKDNNAFLLELNGQKTSGTRASSTSFKRLDLD